MDARVSEQIRQRIESNDLDGAIEQFKGAVDRKGGWLKVSALANRLSRIKERETMNIVSGEEASRERSKIVLALLSLLEEYDQGGVPLGGKNKSFLYVGGGVILLFLIGAGAYALGLFSGTSGDGWRADYEIVREFQEGRAAVFNQAWGYVDDAGALQVPLQYIEAADFNEGQARVKTAGAYFFIDKAGNCIQDCEKKEEPGDGMKVEFNGDNNQAIDARGGKVIINEDKE